MDLLNIRIRADTSGADQATAALDKTSNAAARTGRETNSLVQTFRSLGPLAGTLMAAFSARVIGEQADQWAELQARAVNATGSMEAGTAVMGRLEQMARSTYSSLDQTAESWLNNATNLSAMGVSVEKQLDLVQSLNDALVISATRGQRAESVQRAWTNAMALGTLRGNDLNAVLTGSDRLAQALADSMGVNITELRRLGREGKITRAELLGLTSQMEKLAEEAGDMPATLADARQIWSNTMTAVTGLMDQALGASESLAGSLIGLADRFRAGADTMIRTAVVLQTGFNAAVEMATNAISSLGIEFDGSSALIIAGAGAASLAVTSLATAMATTLVGAIRIVGVAMLANPLGLWIAVAATAITAIYLFRDEIKQAIGVDVVEIAKTAANTYVGFWVGAFTAMRDVWSDLPSVMGDLAVQAGQAFVNGIVEGLNKAQEAIREFFSWVNPVASILRLGGLDVGELVGAGGITPPQLHNPWSGTASDVGERISGHFSDALSTNYVGKAGEALGQVWRDSEQPAASLEELMAQLDDTGAAFDSAADKAGKASKEAQKIADAYKKIVDGAEAFIASQEMEQRALGMTAHEAAVMRHEHELLAKAYQAGIPLTERQAVELGRLAERMADAEMRTNALREAQREYENSVRFARDTTKGFIDDLRRGQAAGEGFWKSFGNAAVNAFDRITDRLINGVLDALFQVNNAASGVGGGGFLGNLLAGIGSFLGFANGGVFNQAGVTAFATGGVISDPTVFPFANGIGLMGEAGPEAIMPLKRGPSGRLGVEMFGANQIARTAANQPQEVVVHVEGFFVDDNGVVSGKIKSSEQRSISTSSGQLERYDKSQRAGGVTANQHHYQMLKGR